MNASYVHGFLVLTKLIFLIYVNKFTF